MLMFLYIIVCIYSIVTLPRKWDKKPKSQEEPEMKTKYRV
jgi:hypothetical protein